MSAITLVTSAIVIGLIDSSDPIVYALIFSIFTTKKPIKNFLFFLIPYFILVLSFGIILFFLGTSVLNSLKDSFIQDEQIFFHIVGGLIVLFGLIQFFRSKKKKKERKWKFDLKGINCSISAVVVFFINMPLFILYAGLVFTMIKEKVSFGYSLIIMLIYAFVLILPYILVAILYKKYEVRIKKIMNKVFKLVENKFVFGTILILLGLYLVLG